MQLTFEDIQALLVAMKVHNRPCEIDWTNRTIRVLSEVKQHPTKVLSNGPMKWQDILYQIP